MKSGKEGLDCIQDDAFCSDGVDRMAEANE
jgi:hypothetical protein